MIVVAAWQIIVLELLKNGVISTLVAMLLITIATVLIFGGIFGVVKSPVDQIRVVVDGVPADGAAQDKVAAKAEQLAQRDDDMGKMVRIHSDIDQFFRTGDRGNPQGIFRVGRSVSRL